MRDNMIWFAPKRYGYGAGLPVSWQGWVLVLGYIAVAMVAFAATAMVPALAGVVIATVALLFFSARHTRGGWRWRWGSDA